MKTEHILIIRFSAMGDVAMTVPVVQSLAKQYPELRITFLSRPFARPLFEGLAPNVGFMGADIKKEYHGIGGLNKLYKRIVAKNITAVADLHNVLRSGYLRLRFNLGRYRVEHIDKHRNERKKLVAQTDKRLVPLPTAFQNYADVFAKLGYPIKMDFTSIFPPQGGNLRLRQEGFSRVDWRCTFRGSQAESVSARDARKGDKDDCKGASFVSCVPFWQGTRRRSHSQRHRRTQSAVPECLGCAWWNSARVGVDEPPRRDDKHG